MWDREEYKVWTVSSGKIHPHGGVLREFGVECSSWALWMESSPGVSKLHRSVTSSPLYVFVCVNLFVLVAQSCPALCSSMDCSPPVSSVHGILQARMLEWVAFPFSRWSSEPRDWTQVSHIAGRFFTIWTTREVYDHDAKDDFYILK